MQDPDLYYVAIKLFIRDGDKLLILSDSYGDGDLPGGRLNKDEFGTSLENIVSREVTEELGPDLKYQLGGPAVFMRHERIEQSKADKPTVRIFAIGFEAKYLGGEIRLSDEHANFVWESVKDLKPEQYFEGGWLIGVQEYLRILSQGQ